MMFWRWPKWSCHSHSAHEMHPSLTYGTRFHWGVVAEGVAEPAEGVCEPEVVVVGIAGFAWCDNIDLNATGPVGKPHGGWRDGQRVLFSGVGSYGIAVDGSERVACSGGHEEAGRVPQVAIEDDVGGGDFVEAGGQATVALFPFAGHWPLGRSEWLERTSSHCDSHVFLAGHPTTVREQAAGCQVKLQPPRCLARIERGGTPHHLSTVLRAGL